MFAQSYEDMVEAPQNYYKSEGGMSSSTSPSPPAHSGERQLSTGGGGAIRRPPRKSTLTQQQKNMKRQRATQDQLSLLEVEFNKNPTPTAVVRERIAQDINMTERSVQIWFQNRRAKIKLLAKKSIETGEDCDGIPESVRIYLANQNPEMKGLARLGAGGRLGSYPGGYLSPDQAAGKIFIHHFKCRSLTVGTWRRVGQNAMDLVIFYSIDKQCITYYINNDSAGYKIEYPFSYIRNIELETLNVPMAPMNTHGGQTQGQLVIDLIRPPNFFMDTSGQGGFVQCGDFTEDQQATTCLTHLLGGNSKALQSELSKLLNVEAYQNRHMPAPMFSIPDFSISAPHSPIHRPASASEINRPSFMQQEARGHSFAIPQRGHRRQRSRSVPNAMDLSMFQHQPMPSFHFEDAIAEPDNEGQHELQSHSMFAPAPMHPNNMSNNLRIDTAAPGFLDYRQSFPLSAATSNGSVSEYAPSPGLMPNGMHGDLNSAGFASPYNMPWLSPMMGPGSGMPPQSISPLSALSHNGDPIIATGSPPLMDRSGSAELFPLHQQTDYHEDGLSELYAKQSLMLNPFTPPTDGLVDVEGDMQQYSMSPLQHDLSLSPEQQHNHNHLQ